MPGRVRRLLRLRPSREIRRNSVLDPNEVAEVEALSLSEFAAISRVNAR